MFSAPSLNRLVSDASKLSFRLSRTFSSLSVWRCAATRRSVRLVYRPLSRKLVNEICCACGTWRIARSVRSRWVMTRSTSGGRLLIAQLVTEILLSPASCTFLRSTPAPIALEPIPASQATMILRTWLRSLATSPAASGVAPPLDCAFISCIRRVAASISSSSLTLLVFSSTAETTKETAMAATIAAMLAK